MSENKTTEKKVSLLWHDITLLKERKSMKLKTIAFCFVSFAIGLAIGILLV